MGVLNKSEAVGECELMFIYEVPLRNVSLRNVHNADSVHPREVKLHTSDSQRVGSPAGQVQQAPHCPHRLGAVTESAEREPCVQESGSLVYKTDTYRFLPWCSVLIRQGKDCLPQCQDNVTVSG